MNSQVEVVVVMVVVEAWDAGSKKGTACKEAAAILFSSAGQRRHTPDPFWSSRDPTTGPSRCRARKLRSFWLEKRVRASEERESPVCEATRQPTGGVVDPMRMNSCKQNDREDKAPPTPHVR